MKFLRFALPVLALLLLSASFNPAPANAQQYGGYNTLRIDRAIYDKNGQGYDVTRQLRHWIRNKPSISR